MQFGIHIYSFGEDFNVFIRFVYLTEFKQTCCVYKFVFDEMI